MIDRVRSSHLWRAQEATWSPARVRFAMLTVGVAIATVGLVVALGGGRVVGITLYMIVTLAALFLPAAIAIQVGLGQLLVGQLLLGAGSVDPLLAVPAFAGVVAGAELLAVVAWLDSPLRRQPTDAGANTGRAVGLAAVVFGSVLLLVDFPGPTGILAVVLASAACGILAGRLARTAPQEE
jgi:hypothetical protein